MSPQTSRSARAAGLVAVLAVCLLLVQVHALLHTHGNMDCKVCTGGFWMAPSAAPAIENPSPATWIDSNSHDGYRPQHEFRHTAPRAPPAA